MSLLPPRNKANEGYVFTAICESKSGGVGKGVHNTSLLPLRTKSPYTPDYAQAGGNASYWNALLLNFVCFLQLLANEVAQILPFTC